MVIAVTLRLEDLFREGKNFKWERPCACPKCEGKLWGHGYTPRFFQGFSASFWLRRFRCIGCKIVITLRPAGFWPRLQSSIEAIYEALHSRLLNYRWPLGMSRQRGGHWLRRFHFRLRFHAEWKRNTLLQTLAHARESGLCFV